MHKTPKVVKKSTDAKHKRKYPHLLAEIVPIPTAPEEPIKSENKAVEIDKWLKLVESYWEQGKRRKS
jgi:hypothetical protein